MISELIGPPSDIKNKKLHRTPIQCCSHHQKQAKSKGNHKMFKDYILLKFNNITEK